MKKSLPMPSSQDAEPNAVVPPGKKNPADAALPAKVDKRKEARQEHTNHFTNRQGHPEKK